MANAIQYLLSLNATQALSTLNAVRSQMTQVVRTAAAGAVGNAFGGIVSGAARAQTAVRNLGTSLTALHGLAGTAGAAFAVASIKSANDAEVAFLGFQSSLKGTTDSLADYWAMVQKYSKDGLVSQSDAAASIRNLKAVGYNAQEIDSLMQKLMDRAAFNREAHYSTIGEGVKTFTSALVTGNSELSNSLLMEQNLSQVEKEYIQQNGLLVTSLNQRQKAQAYLNWIVKESMANEGDAKRLLDSSAGSVMKLEQAYSQLKVTLGSELAPTASAFIDDFLIPLTKALGLGANAWGEFVANMKEGVKALKESSSLDEADSKFIPKIEASAKRLMKKTEETLQAAGFDTYPDPTYQRDYTPTHLQPGTLSKVGASKIVTQPSVTKASAGALPPLPGNTMSQAEAAALMKSMPPVTLPNGKSVPLLPPATLPGPNGKPVPLVDGPTRATLGTADIKNPALIKKNQDAAAEKQRQEEAKARLEKGKRDIDAAKNTADAQLDIAKSKQDAETARRDDARARERITDGQYARQTADNELNILDQQAQARADLINKTYEALRDATIANDPEEKIQLAQQLETLVAQQQAYNAARQAAATKANTAIFEADKATAQKARQLAESALETSLKTQLTMFQVKNDKELADLESQHEQKLISEHEYLTRLEALQKAALAKEDEQARARIDFLSQQKPLDQQDAADLKSKLSEQQSIIKANAVKVEQISKETATKQAANAIELAKMQADLDAQLAEAEGRTFEAKARQIDQWLAEKRAEFAALPELMAKAEAVAAAQKKGNRFDEESEKTSSLNSDYDRQQADLQRRSQQGLLTDIALDRQSLALKKAQAAALRERLVLLKENSNGGTSNSQAIQDLESQIADLDASFSETAASINESFFDSIGQGFRDLATGAKSFGDVMRNIIANVLSKLAELKLSEALDSFMASAGGKGGGLGGALTNFLFGGFRASGGDVRAGSFYVVGEKGPELMVAGANGRVVSNAQIQSALTGSTMHRMSSPLTGRAVRQDLAPAPSGATVNNHVTPKVFVTSEAIREALRNDPGFERDIVDINVNNRRRIESRS
jgi:hypothetical protein